MGKLTSIFRQKNAIFLQRKHQNTNTWQKTKNNRIQKFLYFCESKNIKDIHKISKKNFDEFVKNLITAGKSSETIRQYALALAEFFRRAHLDISVSPARAKNRKIAKKIEKIIDILKDSGIESEKIEKIIPEISKIL